MLFHGQKCGRILLGERVTIGRDAKSDVVLNVPAVSRQHAMIQRADLKPQAMLNVLKAQVQTTQAELDQIATPILVVSGAEDNDTQLEI